MGAPEYHPSPSHTPPMQQHSNSWSSVARKNTLIDVANWRTQSSRCNCALSMRPDMDTMNETMEMDLPTLVFYAHQYGSFQRAHHDFETVKDLWTPELFGEMIAIIAEANCTQLDAAVREFHQQIRNNGLWQAWIDGVKEYPRFEALLLDELAHVLENLSPRYLKDVKLEHLLKIFSPSEMHKQTTIHGKKRKLKRQITKWIETQSDEVLNDSWESVNQLKWRLQCVIDQKDREQEERTRNKTAFQYNWRQKSISPRTVSPQSFIPAKESWPELARKTFETIPIGA